ncbi:MAG: diguanylate cyclase [Pseudomonadota bacterium]
MHRMMKDPQGWQYALLTAFGYYLGAQIGVKATFIEQGIAILWPPNAVLLTALLLSPVRRWPLLCLAVIPAEIVADLPTFTLAQATLFALVNIFESSLAAGLLLYTVGRSFALDRLRNVALFGLFAMGIASGLAALLGAAVYTATTSGDIAYWAFWRIWWFGDGLGLLITFPILLTLFGAGHPWHAGNPGRVTELTALTTVTLLAGIWIFSQPQYLSAQDPMSPILLLPLTLWSAIRFGVRGAAFINLVIGTIGVYFTVHEVGPFTGIHPADATLRLQEYLAALAFSSLALAAVLREIARQNDQLRILDRTVSAIQEGVIITDARAPDNPIIYVNPSFETVSGYAPHEVIGRNPRFLQSQESPEEEREKLRLAIHAKQAVRVLLRNHRKDGSLYWNDLILSPIRDEHGQVSHFIGIQHDVTELISSRDALTEAHDQLNRINLELEHRIEERTEELLRANQRLEILAATDPLTGTYNRRHFFVRAAGEIERSERHGHPLSCISLDIDFFKRINDHHGHAMGDKVLQALTDAIQESIRPSDLFARFGGEEFILLLPDTTADGALRFAHRLREKLNAIRLPDGAGGQLSFTVSMGVAEYRRQVDDIDKLIQRADQGLYQAKEAGRDCIRQTAEAIASGTHA